uniref:F-box/LRR-repeat protein 8 n=1 Tax=Strigamia maritima TaxID=126957 RepID=T1JID9_STRMM
MACLRLNSTGWQDLPDHIILQILSYLSRGDQYHAALTCASWYEHFLSPYNWRKYTFRFSTPEDKRHAACINSHGDHLRSIRIQLDQYESYNREMACATIRALARCPQRRLEKFIVQCSGRNPLFYAGLEFVGALQCLFGIPPNNVTLLTSLKCVDLSGLPFLFDDALFEALATNHPKLEYFNIQNSPLVCKVTPVCILNLVKKCRNLTDLRLLNCSLSEKVLLAFIEEDRYPLQHLGITCRREEKYTKDLTSGVWKTLVEHLPNLRVTLRFDHTCPLHKISQVLKPEIPCSVLRLETFTFIHDEIRLASQHYAKTLNKLIVQTRPSKELNAALLILSDRCIYLKSLHIFCVLDKETVEVILQQHPDMKTGGNFTLRHEVGPDGVWVTEEELNL